LELRVGQRIDRYELVCPIAQGGMGAVWLARLRRLRQFDKLVAIKTVLPQHAADLRHRRMFLDEARVALAVAHPNVASILDVGAQDGMLYIVMEWIEGESLRALDRAAAAKKGRLPPAVLLRVMADACAGLHAVHEARSASGVPLEIVHRDVSPQNVLVDVAGHARLIDFGVARSRDRLAGDTTTGGPKGKARYMAPEQALGKSVDRRSDIWSAGAVLYSILEGRAPYEDESDVSILRAILAGRPIPPLSAAVPPRVAKVILRSLRVDPADRYPTAAEMKRALEDAMRADAVEATTTEVAAFLVQTVGAQLAERKALVAATLSGLGDLSAASVDRTSVPTVPATIPFATDGDAKPAEEVRTFAPTTQAPATRVLPSSHRARRVAAYGGAGAAALVLAALLLGNRLGSVRVAETRDVRGPAVQQGATNPPPPSATPTEPQPAVPPSQASPAAPPLADAAAPPDRSSARRQRPAGKGVMLPPARDPLDNRQ
jgi:serine/threonine-protein kinase